MNYLVIVSVVFAFVGALSPAHAADAPAATSAQSAPAAAPGDLSARAMNLKIEGANLVFGEAGVDFDCEVGPSLTVGPSVLYLHSTKNDPLGNQIESSAMGIGIRANIYLTGPRFTTGWYVAPSIYYIPLSVSDNISGVNYSTSMDVIDIKVTGGYQWVFRSGFNVTAGAGLSYYSAGTSAQLVDNNNDVLNVSVPRFTKVQPALEVAVGWIF